MQAFAKAPEKSDPIIEGFFARKVVKAIKTPQEQKDPLGTLIEVQTKIIFAIQGQEQSKNQESSNCAWDVGGLISRLHEFGLILKVMKEKKIENVSAESYMQAILKEVSSAISRKSIAPRQMKATLSHYDALRDISISDSSKLNEVLEESRRF